MRTLLLATWRGLQGVWVILRDEHVMQPFYVIADWLEDLGYRAS